MLRPIALASALWLAPPLPAAAWEPPALSLPGQMAPQERARLEEIARNAFASTRMEGEPFTTRAEVFEYLLDHPEFASHVTRALKTARYRIWHTEDGLWLDDGWGVKGQFAVAHAARGLRVLYARGRYEPRLLPDINGRAVVTLGYAFRPDAGGRSQVATTLTAFVQLDSRFLHVMGKIGSPLVQAKADREARGLLRVFARVSRAIEDHPAEVYRKVSERPDVPRPELEEFRRLLRLPLPGG